MEPEALYQWILKYGPYVAQAFLVIAAALMVKSRKGVSEFTALIGFAAFLVGSLMMHETKGTLVHIGSFNLGSRDDRQLWQVGQAISILGFLAGSSALMLNRMFRR